MLAFSVAGKCQERLSPSDPATTEARGVRPHEYEELRTDENGAQIRIPKEDNDRMRKLANDNAFIRLYLSQILYREDE